ncbi:hypothetical protein [Streptomyces olivaceoviridis]|uniref:hypothetical protein n=1 Tax=Streptomyces olivaceoviridis TaxID=1921 RepID=UPI003322E564
MTVAVMEAELLQPLLAEHGRQELAPRFFAAAATLLAEPWSLATGGDLRFPEVEGERGPQDEEVDGYLDQFRASAALDPVLGTAFLKVANMIGTRHFALSSRLGLVSSYSAGPRCGAVGGHRVGGHREESRALAREVDGRAARHAFARETTGRATVARPGAACGTSRRPAEPPCRHRPHIPMTAS